MVVTRKRDTRKAIGTEQHTITAIHGYNLKNHGPRAQGVKLHIAKKETTSEINDVR